MRLLLDTHVLLWSVAASRKLSKSMRRLIESPTNEISFSAASLWEIAVKLGLRRSDFDVDPVAFADALGEMGFEELPVRAAHALHLLELPALHKDPFDRILVAQSRVEGMLLVTNDGALAGYGPSVRVVD
jgi:PIN domain nuclease of toxin-antitoxin system